MDRLIIVYRLDTERGHEVQFWPFEGKTLIRIGRALDNDMVFAHLPSPATHVYLKHDDGGWRAFSISQQGIYDGATKRMELPLSPGTVFRLGRSGPVLRFAPGRRGDLGPGTVRQPRPSPHPDARRAEAASRPDQGGCRGFPRPCSSRRPARGSEASAPGHASLHGRTEDTADVGLSPRASGC